MSALFNSIGTRLLVLVGGVVVIGMFVLIVVYAERQEETIFRENEQALEKVTSSVAEGISALMLKGHAKAAEEFAGRLKTVPNIIDFRIVRADGTEAYVDNSTVDKVNDVLGDLEFFGRKENPDPVQVLAPTDPNLQRIAATGERIVYYRTLPGGERHVTMLGPIQMRAECTKCHGTGDSIRGLIKLTTSLERIDADIAGTRNLALIFILIGLVIVIGIIYWVARRTVVDHIVGISRAMENAATGDLSRRLDASSHDEIGHMARAFNQMSEELLQIYKGLRDEQSKLNTIILGADSGIVVTDAEQQIVLANPAACELIGKAEENLVRDGLMTLFDDPNWLSEQFTSQAWSNTPALLERGDRVLSVQTSIIRDAESNIIGSAVLIRDVTEEKRLEALLKRESITDALTGLYNRRHFDETMLAEFKRWRRYRQPLSLIMIDIDHFKKFNDTNGHECGDHVLEAIGNVLCNISTHTVVACRYGGEEMVVIMPGARQSEAAILAEALRLAIAALVIDGMHVTASFGVAGVPEQLVENESALLKLADDALYSAKANGRNQVCTAAESSTEDGPEA